MGISVGIILLGSSIVFSEPGSKDDPLVTLSYVNNKIDALREYIDVKLEKSSDNIATTESLEIVELSKGEKLIATAGTEIILRGGRATAYGVEMDRGITDVTEGKDIDNEIDLLSANHLLLVPRDDGRGVYAVTDSIFMIKGSYLIR